jgi:N-methylhydantoinase B
MTSEDSRIDKMLVSVLQNRFKSITEEMGLTLLRTTRSPILNEARDFVTGLYDYRGRMLEQTEYIPILAFALQPVCQYVMKYFGDDIHAGDVFIHNDVFTGGNQNADVAIFKPIFFEDRLVAWSACKGHQADIGGNVAGGYNPDAREVWQEALRIPPLRLFDSGKLRKDVWDFVFANIRFSVVEEDIKAQIGGCVVGERGYLQLCQKYGADVLQEHIEYLFDVTEERMRAEIRKMPEGTYRAESYMYSDGIDEDSRHRIAVELTISDGEVFFDYTGTDPQTRGFANAPYGSTVSALMLTFLMVVEPNMPHNDGLMRPIKVHIPSGSLLNANFPAATTFGNTIANPHSDALFKVLAQVVPDRVTAGWNRLLGDFMSGYDPSKNRSWADILFIGQKGGSGATEGVDGYDHIGLINCAGGILAQDYEMFEVHNPLFLLQHEYTPDSAGAGWFRGGLGVQTEFEIQGTKSQCVTYGDGLKEGAFGLFGGLSGSLNWIELRYPDGTVSRAKSKEIISNIPQGSVFFQAAGGGGGYGDPAHRPIAKVVAEVKEGLISPGQARAEYLVAVSPETLELDEAETATLRGARESIPDGRRG